MQQKACASHLHICVTCYPPTAERIQKANQTSSLTKRTQNQVIS